MKNYLFIILSFSLIFSFSCAKKKKQEAQPEGDIFISGSVKEPLEGKPIITARVIVEDSSGKKLAETKTDEFGVFHTKLKKDDIKGDLKVRVEHQGYAPLSKVIRKDSIITGRIITARQISLELTPDLVDSNFITGRFITGRYYKNEDGTETMKTSSGQAMITGRFITGRMITGGTPSFISRIKSIFKKDEGGVSAEITVGDPDKNIGSFPGDFQASDPQFAKASGSSERVQLATSGWIDLTFRDSNGNPVQVVSKDNPAIVMRRIPDSQQKDVIEAYKRGVRSIPWYYYDEGEGIWKRTEFDANVILVNEDVDGDGVQEEVAYAQVPITHTSWYNIDFPLDSTEICFQGKVLDANGRPIQGLYVIAYSSSSYAYARTDDKGEFKLYVPQAKSYKCLEWKQECWNFCWWGQNCWNFCWTSCEKYSDEILEYWRFKIFAADEVRWGEIQERTRVLEVSTEGKEKYKCHDLGVLPPPEMYSLSCSVKDVSGNPLVGASVVSSDGKAAETDSSGKFTLISKKGNLVLTVSYEKDGRIYKAQKEIYVDRDINEDVCSIVMRLEPVKIKCSAFINQKPGEIEVFVNGNSTKTNQDGSFEVSIPRPVREEEVRLLYIAKFPDGSTEGQVQIIKVKPDDTEVLCPQNINFEYNEVCVEGQVKNEEGKGIRGVYVLVGGKSPVITDEGGFFKVQGGRAKKTEEGKYKYKVKYIYLSPYGREEVENEYEAKGTECVWDKQEIDTRPAWLIGTVKTKRGRHIGGARVETEFGEVDYTNPGGQFKLKAPTNSKVKVYASYGGATTQVEVQTKEKGSTASVDIILNVENISPKIKVLGLGKAKPGGKLKFKIEITDDSDSVGYGVRIKDWGFSDSGTIKLEGGKGEKEFEVVVPAGAKSADLEVEAKDTGGNEDRVVMKVEVVEKNRAPEIIRIDVEGEVWIGGRFIASAVAYDPEGDEMSYEWVLMKGEKDYSGWMMVYGATAVVDVPENASGGTYLMKVKVKDSEGGERIFAREIKLTKELKKGESVCVPSEEICDGLDNDCNGLIDDGVKLVFYKDLDGDGYTDGTTSVGCSAPQGYVLSALLGDCNDEDNQINPGKTEICDGIDNNCNGLIDEGVKLVFYKDLDGDGYTDGTTQVGCSAPSGYVLSATSGDCNDNDPTINPAKTEICDGKDNNCNGQIDEGVLLVFYKDKDGDGYGDVNDQTLACAQPTGYVSNSSDCNDNDTNVNPGKTEICDGKDNNCNGQTDEGFNVGQSCTVGVGECARTGQYVCKADGSGTQCNATPGTPTTEICDGKDNDCDGQTDEGNVCGIAGGPRAKVGAGWGHTCAIKQDGSLWCWGRNNYGQLGDGTYSDKATPVQIMSSGVSSVALGDSHTCAVRADGSLWCWGRNNYGQLGDGTNTSRNTPVQIMSSGVSSVALGDSHTCAVRADGSLWCWGWNNYGQLGDGTNTSRTTPVQIMSSGVSSVALGSGHTCAVRADGSLWCWGWNNYGQLGDGTNTSRTTPVQIMSSGVSSVALGSGHTCAVRADGSLWCWGYNWAGQLGDGTNTSRNTPVQIMSSGVSSVALGGSHTCAVKTDGSLWCWGNNGYGQLGDGTNADKTTPVQIMSSGVSSVALGGSHTCAVRADGSLWCWGWNYYGQLGDGTNTSRTTPVQIMSSGVSSVALGSGHTCAVRADGSLWCWGYNWAGQLGDGTNADKTTPVQIMSSGVSSVALGDSHTCAVRADGSLWCWGNNGYGQLGDGTNADKTTPVQIMSSGVSSVALGSGHTCAVRADGSLWCWGWNYYGQLGDGTNANKNTPVQIMSSGVSSVALGGSHTCAVKTDGSLWCWGNNGYGQLGDGTNTSRNTPVQIMSSGVSSVALGGYHTCAVKTDGSLWCWGLNNHGQLGDGTNTRRNTPVQIMSSGVSSVALGGSHTCAVRADGSLWCWGNNGYGQLGDGTNTSRNTPVQIMSSGVSSVALGGYHTCAVRADGSLWCWGRNNYGQLGDGSAWKNTPVYIMNLGSGGGGAPSIRDESSFGNREQKQANIEQKQTRYGCSSANIVFYVLHLFVPAFILFALLKSRFFVRN